MATLRDIRNRIKSIKNTQQITKAMKMVSAAKLRKAQDMALSGREYNRQVTAIIKNLALLAGPHGHPLFKQIPEEKVDLIFCSSDKGLCGSFNSNLIRSAQMFIDERPATKVSLIAVGKKGRDFFHRRSVDVCAEFVDISRSISLETARLIAAAALERIKNRSADATYILFGRFVSVMTQKPALVRLFPIESAPIPETETVEYLYEPSRDRLIDKLIQLYTDVILYQAIVETAASEHGARMSAMDTASKNAAELIGKLTLFYNRSRQAAITKELIEVVSGSDALEA